MVVYLLISLPVGITCNNIQIYMFSMDKKYVFTGGFFNRAVGYLSIWNQASLSASDTMKYNVMFEGYYFNMVVAVQAYH